MSSLIGASLIGLGIAFDVVGCLGLLRLPDVYNRMQAATKCVEATLTAVGGLDREGAQEEGPETGGADAQEGAAEQESGEQ